jgi:hypothetical protein
MTRYKTCLDSSQSTRLSGARLPSLVSLRRASRHTPRLQCIGTRYGDTSSGSRWPNDLAWRADLRGR